MTAIDGRPRGKHHPVRFEEVTAESSWPPAANGMPPLPYEDFPDTLLAQYIGSSGSLEGDYDALVVNLARLADKAVSDYRAARDCLDAFLQTPGVETPEGHTLLLRATGLLENCIETIARAETHFSSAAFKAITTAEQQQMLKDLHQGVRDIRNSVQHPDERLVEGRIPEGEPLFPAMTTDCIYFAGEYLMHGEIASLAMSVWYLAAAGVEAAEQDVSSAYPVNKNGE